MSSAGVWETLVRPLRGGLGVIEAKAEMRRLQLADYRIKRGREQMLVHV